MPRCEKQVLGNLCRDVKSGKRQEHLNLQGEEMMGRCSLGCPGGSQDGLQG